MWYFGSTWSQDLLQSRALLFYCDVIDYKINKVLLNVIIFLDSLFGALIDVIEKQESVQKEIPFNAKAHADNLVIFWQ